MAKIKSDRLKPVLLRTGGIMTAVSSHSIGQYLQLVGIGAFVAGAVLSLHHYAIVVCFIAGAASFFIGKKLKAP
jgi:hypothetical protein